MGPHLVEMGGRFRNLVGFAMGQPLTKNMVMENQFVIDLNKYIGSLFWLRRLQASSVILNSHV